jgi:hypothetical protein
LPRKQRENRSQRSRVRSKCFRTCLIRARELPLVRFDSSRTIFAPALLMSPGDGLSENKSWQVTKKQRRYRRIRPVIFSLRRIALIAISAGKPPRYSSRANTSEIWAIPTFTNNRAPRSSCARAMTPWKRVRWRPLATNSFDLFARIYLHWPINMCKVRASAS